MSEYWPSVRYCKVISLYAYLLAEVIYLSVDLGITLGPLEAWPCQFHTCTIRLGLFSWFEAHIFCLLGRTLRFKIIDLEVSNISALKKNFIKNVVDREKGINIKNNANLNVVRKVAYFLGFPQQCLWVPSAFLPLSPSPNSYSAKQGAVNMWHFASFVSPLRRGGGAKPQTNECRGIRL
jgi:hypothetical protein